MAPVGEDMLQQSRAGLPKAVVMGPGRAILFYGRCSLGEGLSLGKARDTTFTLTDAGAWVGKSAHLAANPLTIQEYWQVIAQAITECWIEVRGPGSPHSHPTTPQAFRFYCGDESPREECIEDTVFDPSAPTPQFTVGRDHERQQRNPRLLLPQPPHLPTIEDSKVIRIQCQQLHQ